MELLSTLRTLNRADKLHVMQFLISELAQQELDLPRRYRHTPSAVVFHGGALSLTVNF